MGNDLQGLDRVDAWFPPGFAGLISGTIMELEKESQEKHLSVVDPAKGEFPHHSHMVPGLHYCKMVLYLFLTFASGIPSKDIGDLSRTGIGMDTMRDRPFRGGNSAKSKVL